MRRITCFMFVVLAALASGCTGGPPKSFVSLQPSGWSSVEVRDGVDYTHAWDTVVSVLVQDFDLDMAQRSEGYIRTAWLYTWTGKYEPAYRVRVTVKFNEARTTISIKTEAQYNQGEVWVLGADTRLVSTIKTDIMGKVARTTR